MSEQILERCGWCDVAASTAYGPECPQCGQVQDHDDWDDCQRVIRLGSELHDAIERGRRLHPWEGHQAQADAIRREVSELVAELEADNPDVERIYAEAKDITVCAYRAKVGR